MGLTFHRGRANWAFQCGVPVNKFNFFLEKKKVFEIGHQRFIKVILNLPCQLSYGSRLQLVRRLPQIVLNTTFFEGF